MAFLSQKLSFLFFLLAIITSFNLTSFTNNTSSSTPTLGVTINHLPSSATPESIVAAVTHHRIAAVQLTDPDPNLIRAFANTSVSLLLSIPNHLVHFIAANCSNAAIWLHTHVVPFYPRVNISTISVGSEFLSIDDDVDDGAFVPAMLNLHSVLNELGFTRISVSTTFSFDPTISLANPPAFGNSSLLDFISSTNSSFLVKIHPYCQYRWNHNMVVGWYNDNELWFSNLHNAIDAVLSALKIAGHEKIPVVIAETGWPHSQSQEHFLFFEGTFEEHHANRKFAEMYLRGLLKYVQSEAGKEKVSAIYIYEMFDQEISENNNASFTQWGIFYPNMTSKYDLKFGGSYASNGHGLRIIEVGIIGVSLLIILLTRNILLYLMFIALSLISFPSTGTLGGAPLAESGQSFLERLLNLDFDLSTPKRLKVSLQIGVPAIIISMMFYCCKCSKKTAQDPAATPTSMVQLAATPTNMVQPAATPTNMVQPAATPTNMVQPAEPNESVIEEV